MKFDIPDPTVFETAAAIAYLDSDGDLIIRDKDGDTVAHLKTGFVVCDYSVWAPHADDVKARFYPGDKLMITF